MRGRVTKLTESSPDLSWVDVTVTTAFTPRLGQEVEIMAHMVGRDWEIMKVHAIMGGSVIREGNDIYIEGGRVKLTRIIPIGDGMFDQSFGPDPDPEDM